MQFLEKVNIPKSLKKISQNCLPVLCREIREFLISNISITGGHLASNLGIVEITVALHYCFKTPKDKIIWDVGHQAYVHKILTGRKNKFDTLRKFGGLSGFPKTEESEHDIFNTGHSSTSISAGLGFALSRDLNKEDYNVISVIGDGSLTGGLALEGLNNAGRCGTKMIVILNDNQMSISENVGGLSSYLNKIRTAPTYLAAKDDVHKILEKVPVVGKKMDKFIGATKDVIKNIFVAGDFFEEIGFKYFGPINGHNIDELIEVLNHVKNINGPVLLHVVTTKGKGYHIAENFPQKYHGVDAFDIETGMSKTEKKHDGFSDTFGKKLAELAVENEKIVAVTAAMAGGTGLNHFIEKFPKRTFDVGIAEAHGVAFCAGMAKNGMVPVFAVYSSFLQRGYDQIVHDICAQNLHVVFAIDRAGIVGADGETHQGIFDLSYLSHIPNMTIMSPKNGLELKKMLEFAVNHNGPIAFRFPRGQDKPLLTEKNEEISLSKSEVIYEGQDIAIIFVGNMCEAALGAYEKLKNDGFSPALINARFIKPIDLELVYSLKKYNLVAVLEDNVKIGGFGSLLLQKAAEENVLINKFLHFAFSDSYVEHGSVQELYLKHGLDADSIYNKIKDNANG